ncbi:MAG: DUF3048 domain-containing protein [Pseudoflavonifractor sp.]
MKKSWLLSGGMALLLLLGGCSKQPAVSPSPAPTATPAPIITPTPTPVPTPTAEPDPAGVNPLSGLPLDPALVQKRPVAIMLNNIVTALPQAGQSQADILYEVLAEGGITRMLGVFQSPAQVATIGSIRSSRPYYLELALGHDAVYIHAGGSEDAYAKIPKWGVTALDGVRGPYMSNNPGENLMWRDPVRRKRAGLEHSVVTTGKTLDSLLPTYGIRLDHEEGYASTLRFAPDGTPANGMDITDIQVPFVRKITEFTYDAQTKRYLVSEYGKPYMDANSDQQVGVTNVLVLKAPCNNTGDSLGHITVDLAGGTGYFACGGKLIDIQWSKAFPDGQLTYQTLEGSPLTLGAGHTYVCIAPTDGKVVLK